MNDLLFSFWPLECCRVEADLISLHFKSILPEMEDLNMCDQNILEPYLHQMVKLRGLNTTWLSDMDWLHLTLLYCSGKLVVNA